MSERFTRGAVVTHRCSYAFARCKTLLYRKTFIPHSESQSNYLGDSMFVDVELEGFKSGDASEKQFKVPYW